MKVWWSINYSFFIIVIGKVNWYINQMSSITKKTNYLKLFYFEINQKTFFALTTFDYFSKTKEFIKTVSSQNNNCKLSKTKSFL